MATFYFNKTDNRYMNKKLTVVYDNVDLTYIDKTDIKNPVLKLGKQMDPLSYNYVYIPEFSRYYFVSEPPIFESGYYRVKLHVDVLMSFKTGILAQNAIIKRQEKEYNLYHVDEKYQLINTNATKIKEFPNSHFSMTTAQFILALTGSAVGHV